jgi:hypothetical protein
MNSNISLPELQMMVVTKLGQFMIAFSVLILLLGIVILLFYVLFLVWKFRNREKESLEYVVLQIAVPRENEIKIDAAEQMFSSLHSIHHGGFWSFLTPAEHVSFEIVARKEDIRFYIAVPHKLMDLVEKQVHGAYPGAEIHEVEEYNLFSQEGKVA